jgi:hypothetical protein
VIQGTLLQKRHLELTQDQLERATQKFVKSRQIGDPEYQAALRDMQQLYEAQRVNAANRYPASGR